uniref:SUMO specific peptidase 7 n=1 Tax=Leptobrachium leishanense TaxID=445787 RepID=A0A8C5LWB0_9ANUR
MTDKQRTAPQPSALVTDKPPTFRIPKKKPEDWSEDVQVNSPLSRVAVTNLRNVTTRKRHFSSYNSFNERRNRDSCDYYTSGCNAYNSSRPENQFFINIGSAWQKSADMYPEKGHALERKERRDEIAHEGSPSKACRDVSNRQISSQKDSVTLMCKKSEADARCHNIQEISIPECEDQLQGVLPPSSRKRTPEKIHSHKLTGELVEEVRSSPVSASPGKATDKVQPVIEGNCTIKPSKIGSPASASHGTKHPTKSSENESALGVIPALLDSDRRCKRKLRLKTRSNDCSSSTDLIVLSSDEEAAIKIHDAKILSALAETTLTQHCTNEDSKEECSKKESESSSEAECSLLEITFMHVYFGKIKARSTGCVKFSPKSIEIPLKVLLQKGTCLTVDTKKLLRYGLWEKKGESGSSSAVIFLQLDTDYAQFLSRQFRTNTTGESSRTSEFIFIDLENILTKNEDLQLKETMKQASQIGSAALANNFSWDEAYPLLKTLSPSQNSFVLNSLFACHILQDQDLRTQNSAQNLKVKPASSYSLLQRCENGRYSASLVPKQDSTWRPMQNGGLIQKLIVYPPPPTKGGLGVTNEDLACLEHGEFLNDVIIDFYLKYLWLEKFPKAFAERCHIFSSFFFKCLMRKDPGPDEKSNLTSAQRRHQRVKTWTRHVDLFSKDFVFVPVNEHSHWYLVVVCFPGLENAVYEDLKKPSSYNLQSSETKNTSNRKPVSTDNVFTENGGDVLSKDSNCSSSPTTSVSSEESKVPERNRIHKICKRPCFLIFDSLTSSVSSTTHVLREYLTAEWDMKRKSAREFTSSTFKALHPNVPKQDNSTDCGLFLLQYVESFSLKPIENMKPAIHLENWFPLSLVKSKREEIRDLILRLHWKQHSSS